MSNTKYGKAQQICLSTVWLNLWWKFEVQTKQKCCSQILHRSAAASSKLSFNIQHWSYLSPKKWTFAFSLPPAAVVCFPPRLCELSGVQHWDEVALDGLDFLVLCTVEMVQICSTNTDHRKGLVPSSDRCEFLVALPVKCLFRESTLSWANQLL